MNNTIRTFTSFLKIGLLTMICLQALVEAITWIITYQPKLQLVNQEGGLFNYIGHLVKGWIVPELATACVLALLIACTHQLFSAKLIQSSRPSWILYELSFLPVLLTAFLVFIPCTQSVRYLLEEFPNYSFSTYWTSYILGVYSWEIYFRYLFLVVLVGYAMVNVSLLVSYIKQSSQTQAKIFL